MDTRTRVRSSASIAAKLADKEFHLLSLISLAQKRPSKCRGSCDSRGKKGADLSAASSPEEER